MMSSDRIVLLLHGLGIGAGFLLTGVHHELWVWPTMALAMNLARAAMTGYCPLAKTLRSRGVPAGVVFD